MRRISYIMPVDWIRGKVSGNQTLEYDGGRAYERISEGERVSSDAYAPRLIAQVRGLYTDRSVKCFQIRTKTTVNMSASFRLNIALMGGVGALFGSLVRNKGSIYDQCVFACPKGYTLRQWMCPLLRAGLNAGDADITIAANISIVNPWISSAAQNVPVAPAIVAKFADVLSNL